jgi:hypothetical protein
MARIQKKQKIGSLERRANLATMASNPIVPNTADYVPWMLYDRVITAAAANTLNRYTFFNVPIGTAGKIKADTNLEQVMQLSAPEWMSVTHIGFYFCGNMTKLDIVGMLDNYWFEFWIGDRIYAEGPLQMAPSGAGLTGMTTRNAEATFASGNPLGTGVMWDCRLPAGLMLGNVVTDGILGHTILQGQKFNVQVQGTPFALLAAAGQTYGTGLNMMCYLVGLKSRGVQ